jgi:multidrug efflux system membrane fusion protein
MFVRVNIPAGIDQNALLVPTTAIGSDQGGSYVLTVDDQNVVQEKTVTTSTVTGDLTVVDKGLAPTDKVVVNGLQLAIPGEKVAPQNAPPLTAPADIDSAQ